MTIRMHGLYIILSCTLNVHNHNIIVMEGQIFCCCIILSGKLVADHYYIHFNSSILNMIINFVISSNYNLDEIIYHTKQSNLYYDILKMLQN